MLLLCQNKHPQSASAHQMWHHIEELSVPPTSTTFTRVRQEHTSMFLCYFFLPVLLLCSSPFPLPSCLLSCCQFERGDGCGVGGLVGGWEAFQEPFWSNWIFIFIRASSAPPHSSANPANSQQAQNESGKTERGREEEGSKGSEWMTERAEGEVRTGQAWRWREGHPVLLWLAQCLWASDLDFRIFQKKWDKMGHDFTAAAESTLHPFILCSSLLK